MQDKLKFIRTLLKDNVKGYTPGDPSRGELKQAILMLAEIVESKYGSIESETEKLLLNLLATIHRDGGHRVDEIGWEKACLEAGQSFINLLAENEQAVELLLPFPGSTLVSQADVRMYERNNLHDSLEATATDLFSVKEELKRVQTKLTSAVRALEPLKTIADNLPK